MEQTKRKGIKYLTGTNQISDKEFVKFLLSIPEKKLTNQNSSISEKLDGFGFRFGYDGRFFVESSRSGPVYESGVFNSYTEKKFGKKNAISEAYESLFENLGRNEKIQEILKNHQNEKLVCECLYTNLGTVDQERIRFVKTWYDIDKLGTFATFGFIKIVDENGNEIQSNIFQQLQNISDDNIKFVDSTLKEYDICLNCELKEFDNILETYGRQTILSMLQSKKKASCLTQLDSVRKMVEWKLKQMLKSGILGDVEGFVVKKDDTIFKIL